MRKIAPQARAVATPTPSSSFEQRIPSCALPCISSYSAQFWTPEPCGNATDWSCLCDNYSKTGYTFGEIAWACTSSSCSGSSRDQYVQVYYICNNVVGAVAATHTALTVIMSSQISVASLSFTSTSQPAAPTASNANATKTAEPAPSANVTNGPPVRDGSHHMSRGIVTGVVLATLTGLMIAIVVTCCLFKRRRKAEVRGHSPAREKRNKRHSYDFRCTLTPKVITLPSASTAQTPASLLWTTVPPNQILQSFTPPPPPRRPDSLVSGTSRRWHSDHERAQSLMYGMNHMKAISQTPTASTVSCSSEKAETSAILSKSRHSVAVGYNDPEQASSIGKCRNSADSTGVPPLHPVAERDMLESREQHGKTHNHERNQLSADSAPLRLSTDASRPESVHTLSDPQSSSATSTHSYLPRYYTSDDSRTPKIATFKTFNVVARRATRSNAPRPLRRQRLTYGKLMRTSPQPANRSSETSFEMDDEMILPTRAVETSIEYPTVPVSSVLKATRKAWEFRR